MQLNKEITPILTAHKINKSQGILCLLGIYFGLDVETTCSEEVIKAINLTKIVEKDYNNNSFKWNMPLFEGQETAFEWVKDWIDGFGKVNSERKGSWRDATSRMKLFFAQYPEYRKEDVYKARDLYFASLNSSQYCMHSHKFIFDGAGVSKKSTLLAYCEKAVADKTITNNQIKGRVL